MGSEMCIRDRYMHMHTYIHTPVQTLVKGDIHPSSKIIFSRIIFFFARRPRRAPARTGYNPQKGGWGRIKYVNLARPERRPGCPAARPTEPACRTLVHDAHTRGRPVPRPHSRRDNARGRPTEHQRPQRPPWRPVPAARRKGLGQTNRNPQGGLTQTEACTIYRSH